MERASAVTAPTAMRHPTRLLRLTSDERLVALVRAGDEAAFGALYDRHHGALLGFCRHMLGTREEAEDALQHTFLAAYRDLAGSAKPIELRPWLFAIARNRCLSLLRARRPLVTLELAEPATDGLATTVERREDLRELLADLARLPEDQRAALLLAELGALDHAGIATVLGCPREKVKALVFQARSSLVASRDARATPCEQIRTELAAASGGALRRGPLRRHLRACAGCRAFKAEVATQRGLMALALPVVPSVALKASVLSGIGGAHGGGAAAGAVTAAGGGGAGAALAGTTPGAGGTLGGMLGTVASSGVAKVAVSVAIAGVVASGGALTARHADRGANAVAPTHSHAGPAPAIGPLSSGFPAAAPVPRASRPKHPASHARPPRTTAEMPSLEGASPPPYAPTPVTPPRGDERRTPSPPRREADANAGTPPGQANTPPGQGGTPPGQANTPPGQGGTPPGQANTPPGQANTPAGQANTPPGQGGTPPGQAKTPPGQGGTPHGHGHAG